MTSALKTFALSATITLALSGLLGALLFNITDYATQGIIT